jgi:myo-inositol 2-dehydrogenase/D-chiro-inositol 1-dehydrogenase
MINVGFIGAGGIAQTHAAALAHVEGARLVAVSDLVFERAEGVAHQFGATAVAGLAELLQFSGLDIVYILTPPHVHLEQILAALEVGLPIFCEKPLTMTLAEADRAIATARRVGLPLMTGLSHRFHPLAVQARERLLAGELGNFVAVWSHRLTNLAVMPGSWLSQPQLSGGLILQYAMHDLDWESWLGGEVTQVSAQAYHTNPEIEIEDNLWALLQFRNGGSGSVGVSWSAPHTHTERGLIGSQGNLRIINQQRLLGQLANGRKLEQDLGVDYDWFDVFVRENHDVVHRLKLGQPFSISGEDGRQALALSLAVQRAAFTQQMVSLPIHD